MDKEYTIQELVDIDQLRVIFEEFSLATGFTVGFVSYPKQELLITTGWRDICTKFHRPCPASAAACKKSNISLTSSLVATKELSIQRCSNGLVDGATPIIINGKHLASLATGQMLLEPPDLAFFEGQARKYGYDMERYMAALAEVPVVDEARMRNMLKFLSGIAVQIAQQGLNRLRLKEANDALSQSEASLRALSENIPNGVTFQLVHSTNDGKPRFEYISAGLERYFGYSIEQALADAYTLTSWIHPDDAERVVSAFKGSARTLQICDVEGRVLTPTGSVRWIRWRSMPRRLENGLTISDGIATDITRRKAAEAAADRAHRALKVLKECDDVLIRANSEPELLNEVCRIMLDFWGVQLVWVGFAEDDPGKTVRVAARCGRDAEDLEKMGITWADEPRGYGPTGTAIRTGKVSISHHTIDDPRCAIWRDETLKRGYRSAISLPLNFGNGSMGALVVYSSREDSFNDDEVELLKQLSGDLAYGVASLRTRVERNQLQDALLTISEREKQLIAQEMHDGICQHLAGTAMSCKLLERMLTEKGDPGAEYARQIGSLLATGVEETRNLAHGLHPVKETPDGLMYALKTMAGTITKLFHIQCSFQCPVPVLMNDAVRATHLFRIAQEAVNNAIKHGHATKVVIKLHREEGQMTLSVRDNGVGIPRDISPTGMGLQIMKHRASVIGGSITIRRIGKRGTLLNCRLSKPHGSRRSHLAADYIYDI